MKTYLPIILGWTLALLVGVAADPDALPTMFTSGGLALLPLVFVWLSLWEQQWWLVQLADPGCGGACCEPLVRAKETAEAMEYVLLRLRPWCVVFAAAVPLMVLWRLGGEG